MSSLIRVALADDHPSILDGYIYRLEHLSDNIEVVGTALDGEALEALLAKHSVDVLILDVALPISADNPNLYPILHAIPKLLQRYRSLIILVISMHTERMLIERVIKAGAKGYIVKDDQQAIKKLGTIIDLIVHGGGVYISEQVAEQWHGQAQTTPKLTNRQLQVLSLCAAHPALKTHELSERLNVQPSTVRNLLSEAYKRLKVRNRSTAVAKARKLGLITPLQKSPAYE